MELVLRCRRKRRRNSRRWVRLSAFFQTQRRRLATTAVRIWRMMAWTWEVSTRAILGVGSVKGEIRLKCKSCLSFLTASVTKWQLLLCRSYKILCWCWFFLSPPDFDANNIFKAFFGGPGGFSFEGNSSAVSTRNVFEKLCVCILWEYISYWPVVCFSIWTRKFLLPIWLIGGFFYLNRYNVRTFQQCQPPNSPSIFNWLTDCKSDSCLCHWLNECNPMTTCNKWFKARLARTPRQLKLSW